MNLLKKFLFNLIIIFLAIPAFSYSKTDLTNAVTSNSPVLVKKILQRDSNLVKLRFDSEKNTILMIALQNKCSANIIDMILDAGCSSQAKNKSGQTALMFACQNYDKPIVNKILNHGVLGDKAKIKKILETDKKNDTAFDYAKGNSQNYSFLSSFTPDPKTIKKQVAQKEENLTEDVQQEELPQEEEIAQEQTLEENELTNEPEAEENLQEEQIAKEEVKDEQSQTLQEETQLEKNISNNEIAQSTTDTTAENSVNDLQENARQISQSQNIETKPQGTEIAPKANAAPEIIGAATTAASSVILAAATTSKKDEKSSLTESSQSNLTDSTKSTESQKSNDSTNLTNSTENTLQVAEISSTIEIPTIDYYNKPRTEYLFDETEDLSFENKIEDELKTSTTFIENPDTLDKIGRTQLMNAIIKNDFKLCYDLLNSGANVNFKDKDGFTPLMYALKYSSNQKIILLLFHFNADLTLRTNANISTIQIAAAFCKSPEILKLVLKKAHSENLNIQNSFIIALKQERTPDFIKEFLPYIKNINMLHKGKTPLMIAASYYKKTDVLKLLLENGANPYLISSERKLAFNYATENKKIIKDATYWSLNVSTQNKN